MPFVTQSDDCRIDLHRGIVPPATSRVGLGAATRDQGRLFLQVGDVVVVCRKLKFSFVSKPSRRLEGLMGDLPVGLRIILWEPFLPGAMKINNWLTRKST